jgi:hypothetical protein
MEVDQKNPEWVGEVPVEDAPDLSSKDEHYQTIKMTRYLIRSDYFAVTKKLISSSIPLIQEYDYDGPAVKHRLEF